MRCVWHVFIKACEEVRGQVIGWPPLCLRGSITTSHCWLCAANTPLVIHNSEWCVSGVELHEQQVTWGSAQEASAVSNTWWGRGRKPVRALVCLNYTSTSEAEEATVTENTCFICSTYGLVCLLVAVSFSFCSEALWTPSSRSYSLCLTQLLVDVHLNLHFFRVQSCVLFLYSKCKPGIRNSKRFSSVLWLNLIRCNYMSCPG